MFDEPSQERSGQLDPQKLTQMHFSFAASRILTAAVQLGVFSHIAAGSRSAADVAQAAGASERGMRMLLNALVALQLLGKCGESYQLPASARQYLVRESPDYMGHLMEADGLWESWTHLTDCIRAGGAPKPVNQQSRAEEFFPILVRALHVTHREPARRLAEALGAGRMNRGLQVIDIACGSAIWSIAVAEADAEARVTAQDFPVVLELTRRYLDQHGVTSRYDFLPGNIEQVHFEEGRYHLALLGNIVHSEGAHASRELFKRLRRALRPGGRVAILDMIPNDERTGPPFPLIFALNMLVNTDEGDTYTLAEYTRWLTETGFERVETADIGLHSPAIIATRA